MPTIASIPGAIIFRTLITIVLILILMVVFFWYSEELEDKSEKIAHYKVIQELNIALSFYLYRKAIDGNLNDLQRTNIGNPFVVLAGEDYSVPLDYRGELPTGMVPKKRGWYFDATNQSIFYWNQAKLFSDYQLRFIYEDKNGSGKFESSEETIKSFGMVERI